MANQAKSRVPSAATNGKHGHSLISDAKFRQLYGLTLDVRSRMRQANGSGDGLATREAALAAVAADLKAGDAMLVEPGALVAEALRGCADATVVAADGMRFEDAMADCMGRAAGDRLLKNQRVTVIFAPPTETATMREARSMASGAKLPLLFVEKLAAANGKALENEPDGNALPAIPVDARDVVALYRVAHESIARARCGSGPTRILCVSLPAAKGESEDAVEHLEHWLEARGLPAQEWRREIGSRSL